MHMDAYGGRGGEPWYAPNKTESLNTLGMTSLKHSDGF